MCVCACIRVRACVSFSCSTYENINSTAHLLLIYFVDLSTGSVEIEGSFGESDRQKETGSKKRYNVCCYY